MHKKVESISNHKQLAVISWHFSYLLSQYKVIEQHLSTPLIYQPGAAVTDDRKYYMKSLKEDLWKAIYFLEPGDPF